MRVLDPSPSIWQELLLVLRGNAVPLLKMPCNKPFSSRTTSLSSPMCTEFTVVQSSSEEEHSSPPPALDDGPPPCPESEELRLCLRSCCRSCAQSVRSCCWAESISSFICKNNRMNENVNKSDVSAIFLLDYKRINYHYH